jgi:anti-anti-sigma factor
MCSRKVERSPVSPERESKETLQRLAQREFSLQALMDLSRALAQPHDLYGTMDALLLNLMGQFRLSRACLWLLPESGPGAPVLVRSRGVEASHAQVVMTACADRLMNLLRNSPEPLAVRRLLASEDEPIREFSGRAGIQIFAPIYVRDELIGVVGLGARQDGESCTDLDLQLLEASLTIASVALENGRFYGRLLEKGRELRLANDRLEELDRLKFEFLGNVNHELRTPLSIIIASLDCLVRQEEDGSSGQEFLRYARSEADKLLSMVENLLTLTEEGREAHRPLSAIGDIVEAVSAYYRERLPGVSSGLHEFTLALETPELKACFDENHLRTILDALVENAVKFSPAGSKIRLSVRETTEHGEHWARIDVQDEGPGIPAAKLPTIFEPFHQLDGSMTRPAGGMGIGLTLALQLAQGLGGRLRAESEEGAGSCFSLFLPAAVQFERKPADDRKRRGVMMSNDLEISEVENRGRTAVLRLKGRLDAKTSPILLQRVSDIQANGQNLVLNLAEVSFMGSSGIGALLVLVEQFQEQAGVVRLASPSPAVEAVIKLLNLDRFLAVDPTEEKALAEIGA